MTSYTVLSLRGKLIYNVYKIFTIVAHVLVVFSERFMVAGPNRGRGEHLLLLQSANDVTVLDPRQIANIVAVDTLQVSAALTKPH